ncbi:MAG: hypothetical protein JXQ87_02440 [Bacteroidia bacterium]
MKPEKNTWFVIKTAFLSMLFFLAMAFTFNNPPVTKTQTLQFDIVAFDKVLGQLDVMKVSYDNNIYYSSKTKVSFDVVKEFEVLFDFNVNFAEKRMQNSSIKASINGDVYANTETKKQGKEHYFVFKDGEKQKELIEKIEFATVQLYFDEPTNITRCYAEQQGSFNTITKIDEHVYKMRNEKGRENKYYYKNGKLKKAVIDSGLKEFEIVAREQIQ